MPMLALLLLCAGLFGSDADTGDSALRGQILQAEAERVATPSAPRRGTEAPTMQLYHLRQDRVLRLGNQRPLPDPAGGPHSQAGSAHVAQLWERVDGHWKLQRMVSIDDLVTRH
ncbi:hypothetical protein [Stenotrophomonas maltophilia]|uniref:DUF4440 domain-containing protein n=1 Tax=Stenotrophomonas maltophilia (strain R551-3) TaxID=391008 RepID=B4SQN6_STRM5|nr:hypothetical protein [Stenotrophomonas maltophilia]ACF51091.1 hypothetical protein Smal_1386 [Stenotrophomonas maltophilia R551-3]